LILQLLPWKKKHNMAADVNAFLMLLKMICECAQGVPLSYSQPVPFKGFISKKPNFFFLD